MDSSYEKVRPLPYVKDVGSCAARMGDEGAGTWIRMCRVGLKNAGAVGGGRQKPNKDDYGHVHQVPALVTYTTLSIFRHSNRHNVTLLFSSVGVLSRLLIAPSSVHERRCWQTS